jgi:hypothetical protein
VTRNKEPVKRSKLMGKPKQKRTAKPVASPGYHWRQHGAGWDLRKDVYVTSHDGERKRRQPYIAHLSREAFRELKRQHRGAALERAIAQWIADHDR